MQKFQQQRLNNLPIFGPIVQLPTVLLRILAVIKHVQRRCIVGKQERNEAHRNHNLQEATLEHVLVELEQRRNLADVANFGQGLHQLPMVVVDQLLAVLFARFTITNQVEQVEQVDCGGTNEAELVVDLEWLLISTPQGLQYYNLVTSRTSATDVLSLSNRTSMLL